MVPPLPRHFERLLILAALRDELTPTAEKLKLTSGEAGHWRGQRHDLDIHARTTGMGGRRVVAGLTEAIADQTVDAVLLIGLAGGLAPSLTTSDIIHTEVVIDGKGGAMVLAPDAPPAAGGEHKAAMETCLLSQDMLAESPEAKAALYGEHRAAAVDMESYELARAAADRHLPLTVIRAISDPADTALPAVTLTFVRPDGSVDVAAAMKYVATHPWQMPKMMSLQRAASSATEALANYVDQWLLQRNDEPAT